MGINTETLLGLEQLLSEALGDDLEFDTTTNIGAATTLVSTSLNEYDDAVDDHFNDWWVYITEGNNITVQRKVKDYTTSGGVIGVYGANLSAETGAVTCRLHRYNRDHKVNALKRAVEIVYPCLRRDLDDMTLITGNLLPDAHFESWSSATALNWYTATNATLAQTATAGSTRGGTYSAKATGTAADGYFYISSNTYPRLLDLMNREIEMQVWVYPEVADDAFMDVVYIDKDGASSTVSSTTACASTGFTKLDRDSISIPDDITAIEFRFRVATSTKYTIFDDARVMGRGLRELLLPDDFVPGNVSQVHIQTGDAGDDMCDTLHPRFTKWIPHSVINDGANDYLELSQFYTDYHRLRLRGYAPLESLSSDSATITLEAHRIPLLIAQAKIIFYEREQKPVSAEDIRRFQFQLNEARYEFATLFPRLAMARLAEKRKGG